MTFDLYEFLSDGVTIRATRKDGYVRIIDKHETELWVPASDNATAYEPPPVDEAIALAQARAAMVISPLQGILTLGEKEWGKVLAYRDTASWQERIVIDSALDWRRDSQNIAFFGFLLGYTAEQMDALFIAAGQVKA